MEMMKHKYISALLLASVAFPVCAQYDQDIDVEGKYVPEYIRHDRLGLFPKPIKFPLEKSTLEYALGGVDADFTPLAVPIQATAWNAVRDYSASRGYVELGLGSYLQSTLSAGYRIIDTRQTLLGVRLQHNSTSLWKPRVSDLTPDTRMFRYDESLGVYGNHTFEGYGRLDAALDYHIGNFNYYGFDNDLIVVNDNADVKGFYKDAPTQTLNDFAARVSWHSPSRLDNLTWNAGAGVRYFGYRRFYLPGTLNECVGFTGGRETDVNINGGLNFPTSTKSAIGIDLDADFFSYGKIEVKAAVADHVNIPSAPDSYGMVSLTPYYRFNRDKLNVRIGAKIDLAFNAGPEEDRYSAFHIAPAVRLDYDAGPVSFFLHALGGSKLNTLASNYELDYYQSPVLLNTAPVYSPLDGRLGVSFGPFSGFYAGFEVDYRTSRGQYLGGWYQYLINGWGFNPSKAGLADVVDRKDVCYDFNPDCATNLSGFSFGLKAGYDGGRFFKIDAEGHYQRQDGKTGYFNGFDRPEWTASVSMESNPWSTLKFRLSYDLRAKRMMTAKAYESNSSPLNNYILATCRLPNYSSLGFGASYGITDNINVWIQADDLLCRKNYYMPGLREPGLRLSAGAGFTF